jgi:hypothetical protein
MIKRLEDGLYHVQWQGEWSSFGSPLLAKAEAHLSKLQRGLVVFEKIRTRPHQGEFKPGFANASTPRNRLHRIATL